MTVLTIITNEEQAVPMTLWSARLAAAYETGLHVTVINPDKKRALLENSVNNLKKMIAEEHHPLLEELGLEKSEISYESKSFEHADEEITKLIRSVSPKLVVVSRETNKALLHENQVLQAVFAEAPCTVVAIRTAQADPYTFDKILVAVGGGAHSVSALQLTDRLKERFNETSASALTVNTETTGDGFAVAELVLKKVFKKAMVSAETVIPKVVTAKSFSDGLTEVTKNENYHMIIVGSSNVGFLRRLFFGTIPEEVISQTDGPAIAVIRSAKPLLSRASSYIEDWLDLRIPQLCREDRIALIERLRDSSQWNFDFMALMCLSTGIAALGLMQNSAAVVIGAMLVAPLMTPLLGAGLSLVQGNLPLMNSAGRALGFGFITAVVVSLLLGFLGGNQTLTAEMIARGAPNVLDMLVGFLAGLAAAYSSARPNLSAALPGVAIAAALVPPIATIGLSCTLGEFNNAFGAALLFAVNVVCIILGAALSFFASGIRWQAVKKVQARWFIGVAASLTLVSIALGLRWTPPVSQHFREQIAGIIAPELPLAELEDVAVHKGILRIVIKNPESVASHIPELLKKSLSESAKISKVEISTILETHSP